MNKKASGIKSRFAIILLMAVIFLITGVLMLDVSAQVSSTTTPLSPQQTGEFYIKITSPGGTYPSIYNFLVTASSGGYSGTGTGYYKIKDIRAPTMDCGDPKSFSVTPASPTDSDKITITAQASDNVAVTKMELLVDGQVAKTCYSGQCSTSLGPYSAGSSHTASASAYDAAGNKKDCSKTISVVSIPIDCVAAKSGGRCNVGDIGKTITCPGACSANALCSGSTITYVCG